MASDRLMQAIGRIERAVSDLEKSSTVATAAFEDVGLRARHDRLKAEAQATLGDLDRLLASVGR
jgi:hypothetical protein